MYVRGDLGRLRQVVRNLVENAAKYTEPGGRITVTVEQRGGEVALAVSDNGIGIGAENLEPIFEPFTQSHQPLASPSSGLGIGLSVVAESWNCDGGHVKARVGLGLAFSRWGAEANDGRLYARNLPVVSKKVHPDGIWTKFGVPRIQS